MKKRVVGRARVGEGHRVRVHYAASAEATAGDLLPGSP
jgi:hypothetical protein